MNTFEIPIGWALGLVLGTVRAGAFVAAGGLVPRSLPKMARAVPALAFGIFIGHPIASSMNTGDLVTFTAVNAFVGAALGWLLGLATLPFQVAGTMLDTASGLTVGALFDKESGTVPGPIAKLSSLTATTVIIVIGGLGVAVRVLAASVQAVALDGRVNHYGAIGPAAAAGMTRMIRAGVELALPITAVLFLAEIAFGLLNRVAPQINSFLIGLPFKLLAVVLLLGSFVAVFPATADRALADGIAAVRDLLRTFVS